MAGSERRRELRRRRHRTKKVKMLVDRAHKGSMDKDRVAQKLRRMTIGAEAIIDREKLK